MEAGRSCDVAATPSDEASNLVWYYTFDKCTASVNALFFGSVRQQYAIYSCRCDGDRYERVITILLLSEVISENFCIVRVCNSRN